MVRLGPEAGLLVRKEDISYPAQLTTPPTSHKTRLIPLLPVIASTVAGATKTPVPTILFNIRALYQRDSWSAYQRSSKRCERVPPGREISEMILWLHEFQLSVTIEVKTTRSTSLYPLWIQYFGFVILIGVKLNTSRDRTPDVVSLRSNDRG